MLMEPGKLSMVWDSANEAIFFWLEDRTAETSLVGALQRDSYREC